MKTLQIKEEIEKYILVNGGLYANLPHKEFKNCSVIIPNRSEIIIKELKRHKNIKTGIDIGSFWGSLCYDLENVGYDMLAVEHADITFSILNYLKKKTKYKFKTKKVDVLKGFKAKADMLICLNLFHHFVKKEARYNAFINFLEKAEFKIMFFQAVKEGEKQMQNAFKQFTNEDYIDLIKKHTKKKKVKLILDGDRKLYKIW